MQRLYSMFPEGGPGVGLLLRFCVAGTLVLLPVVPWLHVALVLLAACIAAGVITSISCVLGLLVVAASWVESGSPAGSAVADLLLIVAVILLGPGAYPVDARLFGRREPVLPPGGGPRSRQGAADRQRPRSGSRESPDGGSGSTRFAVFTDKAPAPMLDGRD